MRKSSLIMGADTPVSYLYGIGEKKSEALARIGIYTLRDLCYHFPRAYENRGKITTVADACDGDVCALLLTVSANPRSAQIRRGMIITKLSAFDETGKCNITFFNAPFVKDVLRQGETFRFYGKVTRKGYTLEMTSPSYEIYREGMTLKNFVPVYPLTAGISQKQMITAVNMALDALLSPSCDDGIRDILPCDVKRDNSLCDIAFALRNIHSPQSYDDVSRARRRLAFDEIYLFALSSLLSGGKTKKTNGIKFDVSYKDKFLSVIPYKPTSAQMRTINEINADLSSSYVMSRLITGDVGSGKTLCAAYALYLALENGYQAALMAPTEILARQHFISLSEIFKKLGYECELLIGALTKSKKEKIYARIRSGEKLLVIGTHALIEDSVVFSNLGLVVIDEQHRFGAAQREKLGNKSRNCHLISMSATPIPRTLALVLYGDIDISMIDEMPPGRQNVDTFVVDESFRERIDSFIRKNVNDGGQVYIVCPSVEEQEEIEVESGEKIPVSSLETFIHSDEKPKLKAAVNYAAELEKKFPEFNVGFIHGKLKSTGKEKIMADFVAGNIDILVSTTVIEVGVNVPRASLMIIENAEFFGLSGLHQLRGRVGRGDRKSYCVLFSESKSGKAAERLEMLRSTNDGYKIAEYDLETRGPGDFIAECGKKVRQSGEPDLRIAEIVGDKELLYRAIDAAKSTYAADPEMTSEADTAALAEIKRSRKNTC